jgi:hypothetical protein
MTKSFAHVSLALALTSLSAFADPPTRASVVMPEVTTEEAKNAYTTWCITHEMDIVEAESNRVVCNKEVKGGRGFLVQMLSGAGAAPQVRLEISFGQSGKDVVATAKQLLETQSDAGVVHREDFTAAETIAGTQSVLDEVAASLKKPAPITDVAVPPIPAEPKAAVQN